MNLSINKRIGIPPYTVNNVVSSLSEVVDWGVSSNNVPESWKITEGEGVTVFIVDTAGYTDHPDLIGNFVGGVNFSNSGSLDDKVYHGHHCAGLVAANANGIGVIGVAPKAKIFLVKVLGDDGLGTEKTIANGFKFCYEAALGKHGNIKPNIISASLGSNGDMKEAHEWIKKLYDINIPVVCAAGNSGREGVNYPARYLETIAVAAHDKDGKIADFSTSGPEVDFAAPGVDIYSTYKDGGYASLSGTCLTKNAFVYTRKGPISIKDIKIGDVVPSLNLESGKLEDRRVTNRWNRGIKECIKIRTDKSILECTKNHPILTMYNGEYKWKCAGDLQLKDVIVHNKEIIKAHNSLNIDIDDSTIVSTDFKIENKKSDTEVVAKMANCSRQNIIDFIKHRNGIKWRFARHAIKYYNITMERLKFKSKGSPAKINFPQIDSDMLYIGGYFIGDGWVSTTTNSKRVNFAMGVDEEINNRVIKTYKNIFKKDMKGPYHGYVYDDNYFAASLILKLFNEENNKAKEKYIPEWIFGLDKEQVVHFISGLIDSDGNVRKGIKNGYELTTSSKDLSNGFSALLDYFQIKRSNVVYSERICRPPNSPKDIIAKAFSIHFQLDEKDIKCCKLPVKKCDIATNSELAAVTKIEPIGEQEIFDIEVEGNHNFIANNMIVHNSMATPFVVGIIALMLSKHAKQEAVTGKNDCKTIAQIKEHLIKYSIDKGPIGKDKSWGYGIIDINNLIKTDEHNVGTEPIPEPPKPTPKERKFLNLIKKLLGRLF